MLYCVQGSHSHSLYLIYALLSRTQPCRDYALFGGHFWPKSGGGGHKNIFKDRAMYCPDFLLGAAATLMILILRHNEVNI